MTAPLVSIDWLRGQLDSDDILIADATTILAGSDTAESVAASRRAYEDAHIPGAVFVDLINDLNDSSDLHFTLREPAEFLSRAGRLGLDPNRHIIVYDQARDEVGAVGTSKWAARLRWQLLAAGYPKVSVLEGGFVAWAGSGQPVARGAETRVPVDVDVEPRGDLFVDSTLVERAVSDESAVLIDSRARKRYEGDGGFGAYRAGHIPTARHLDQAASLVPGTSLLRPLDELREDYAAVVGSLSTPVISYCGGGVSSVWNVLVLEALGYRNLAVYDGSILEWSRLEKPLVTGPDPVGN